MKRSLWVIVAAVVLAGCASPPPVRRAGGPELADGGALFRYRNSDAKKVFLVGDFNDWSPTADPMADDNGDGDWTLFYPLAPGRYAYKFLVDGKSWVPDPANPDSEPDGFDGRNSVLTVPAAGR
jgi:1,4-alpha-glucan branching enzyme